MWVILKPHLKQPINHWTAISIVIIMAGLGVGALNEIVEFTAVVITPETGVGGYNNTSLDLVADLIGAIIAMIIIRKMHHSKFSQSNP
jgi:putative membrane protein